MTAKINPVVAALDAAQNRVPGTSVNKIDFKFGDQPEVLEAIRRAHKRGLTQSEICRHISTPEFRIGQTSLKNWLAKENLL